MLLLWKCTRQLGRTGCIRTISSSPAQLCISLKNNDVTNDTRPLHVTFNDDRVNGFWLRDHCRCDVCYNHSTNQRNVDISGIDIDIQPVQAELDSCVLRVVWPDGHKSEYDKSQLSDWLSPQKKTFSKSFWSDSYYDSISSIPGVEFHDFMTTGGLTEHVRNILKYGISLVRGVDYSDEKATKAVCERVGMIEETVYGDFWVFSAESQLHADTAYSSVALGVHTDSTYYTYTPGLQTFHCLEHSNGTGGHRILVDGFSCAETLRSNHPKAFDFLTNTKIPFHFLDHNAKLVARQPIIQLDDSGNVEQFRFNIDDRAPLTGLSTKEIGEFYSSFKLLCEIVKKSKSIKFKLEPGTVEFVDNWRVMHGRTSFTGKRILAGCYISRDDFISRARLLNVL